ncbi:MAG: hypothetical protein VKI82_15790 [Leptolyngbya sp.]|nr:hypothetical protein [Leptolyngbya sp.]
MLNLQRALQSDRLLRALTGLNQKAFKELELTFAQVLPTLIAIHTAAAPIKHQAASFHCPVRMLFTPTALNPPGTPKVINFWSSSSKTFSRVVGV